jgi:hypothetical protein
LAIVVGGLLLVFILGKKQKKGWGAMQYPQLTLGMLAIFVYVGVEVAIGSNLGELLKQKEFGGYNSSQIAPFIAMFWGSLMIGRWAGAINAFNLERSTKQVLRFIVPLVAFGVVIGFTSIAGYDVTPLYWYILCVLVQIGALACNFLFITCRIRQIPVTRISLFSNDDFGWRNYPTNSRKIVRCNWHSRILCSRCYLFCILDILRCLCALYFEKAGNYV